MKIKFASWNILADSLSCNEFITKGGDSKNCHWHVRRDCIISKISSMFENQDIDCLALQENDHPHWIKHQLENKLGLKMIHLVRTKDRGSLSKTMMIKINNSWNLLRQNEKSLNFAIPNLADTFQKFQFLNGLLKDEKVDKNTLLSLGITSFTDENSDEAFKQFYTFSEDLYLSDHGISIIFNPKQLQFVKFHNQIKPYPFNEFTKNLVYSKFGVLAAEFSEISSGKNILVFACHLPSSIGAEMELSRVDHIRNLIEYSKSIDFSHRTVFLMDSNTSNLTEAEELIKAPNLMTFSPFADSVGFKNCIGSKGNECFKMRHAQGGQPAKFGSLMFDAIDKILVSKSNDSKEIEFRWKKDLLSEDDYKSILTLRTDSNERASLKSICSIEKWGDDITQNRLSADWENYANIFMKLYPNSILPSDHPPVAAEIQFNS